MRIVSVHLKNIKAHRDKEFSFSPGINVLSGVNGSGKSTIFEAIGYALFGVSAQDFVSRAERFLTIGAKKGEISVVFEPGDGDRYRVSRTVGAAGKWLLAREVGGEFEVEEHASADETEKRIAALLGLSETRALADQFKLVIGPFQNDFLGPFVIKQPAKRQAAFDEILGIDAWRKTTEGTRSLASAIQAKMDTLQAEIAGKMEQVSVLPEKELELQGVRESSAAKLAELEQRQRELEAATIRLAALDAQKERIDSVTAELQAVEERIRSGKDHVAAQQVLVDQSTAAAAVVSAATEGKKAYDAAEQSLKVLREQERQKLLAEKKLAELEKEQSALRATLTSETREHGELRASLAADEKRLADENESLGREQADLAQAQGEADETLARVNDSARTFRELAIHRIDSVLPYLVVALDRMSALDLQAAERQMTLAGSGDLREKANELPVLQRELEKVQGERSQLCGRRESLIEGREKIGAGDCPYFHEPCKNLEAGGGVEVFNARIEVLDAEVARLDGEAEALAGTLSFAQSAVQELAALEQVRLELEKGAKERAQLERDFISKLADIAPEAVATGVGAWLDSAGLSATCRLELKRELKALELKLAGSPGDRRELLSGWSERCHDVAVRAEAAVASMVKEAEAPVQAARLKLTELQTRAFALDGKRRELTAVHERVLQREKAIAAHQARLDSLLQAVAVQKEALSAFAELEAAIKGAAEELERFQGDRDRFIANEKAAAALATHQETLRKYRDRLQLRESELTEKREEHQKLVAGYQPQEHDAAKGERERLVSLVATLKAEVASLAEGIKRLNSEIAALSAVAAEIEKKQAAIEELKEQGTLVKFLRNQVFKNVSTQLSERFREEISSRADRIYRSISDSDEELFWGENYQIVLKDMADGMIRERTDDQLSGGQMMSAVVALRLALLQTIGARIAFFDEPTSNLDAERRENLAKAFRSIDVGQEEVTEHWYDQLFLVSHDVSFTEITDQMIHLD